MPPLGPIPPLPLIQGPLLPLMFMLPRMLPLAKGGPPAPLMFPLKLPLIGLLPRLQQKGIGTIGYLPVNKVYDMDLHLCDKVIDGHRLCSQSWCSQPEQMSQFQHKSLNKS